MIDLGPASHRVADLVRNVRPEQLDAPTPCPKYTLGDLLEHVGGLAIAFTDAAHKENAVEGSPPPGDASRLGDDWQTRIPAQLEALAVAWKSPEAWTGTTNAGGVELSGEEGGLVALNEVVVHGWDVARASGQAYDADEASVAAATTFVSFFSGPGTEDMRGDAFGPEVTPPADATPLDKLVALSGRDPRWVG